MDTDRWLRDIWEGLRYFDTERAMINKRIDDDEILDSAEALPLTTESREIDND